uniref:Lipase maturation factor n=1 Tax=Anguilla anguilla TaxID=7936 RepID=A0A0E9X765_ANGAN
MPVFFFLYQLLLGFGGALVTPSVCLKPAVLTLLMQVVLNGPFGWQVNGGNGWGHHRKLVINMWQYGFMTSTPRSFAWEGVQIDNNSSETQWWTNNLPGA